MAAQLSPLSREVPRPLTEEQSNLLDQISDTDASIQKYLELNPISSLEIVGAHCLKVAGYSVAGGIAGGIVGGLAARVIFKIFACAVGLLAPQVIICGEVACIVIGALTGGCYHKVVTLNKEEIPLIPLSDQFVQWKANAIKSDIYPIFQHFIRTHGKLKDFICPISEELIVFPVKDKNNVVFEKQEIETHLDNCHNNEISNYRTHPFWLGRLKKSDLEFYPTYWDEVIKTLKEVLAEELVEAAHEGLIAYQEAITLNNYRAGNQILGILIKKHDRREISQEEFNHAMKQIVARMRV